MFFTREDILKIQKALLQLGVKDSELPSAEPITYDDTLSIVQEGKNKQIGVKDFFNQISLWKREDFLNITDKYDEHYISLREAINLVPILQRKDGLVITFQDVEGNWEIYQFRGNITEFLNEEKWFDLYDYRNYIVKSIVPDEEDLTASTPDESGNSLISLKNRVYDPTSFSGKGYKILRKNIQSINIAVTKIRVKSVPSIDGTLSFTINGKEIQVAISALTDNTITLVVQKVASAFQELITEYEILVDASLITLTRKSSGFVTSSVFSASATGVVCTITDSTKREFGNILTSTEMNQPNTIYEIKYDFDLDGATINLPQNCILKFCGGSLNNGKLNGNNSVIEALPVKIFGKDIEIAGTFLNSLNYAEWFDLDYEKTLLSFYGIDFVGNYLISKKISVDTGTHRIYLNFHPQSKITVDATFTNDYLFDIKCSRIKDNTVTNDIHLVCGSGYIDLSERCGFISFSGSDKTSNLEEMGAIFQNLANVYHAGKSIDNNVPTYNSDAIVNTAIIKVPSGSSFTNVNLSATRNKSANVPDCGILLQGADHKFNRVTIVIRTIGIYNIAGNTFIQDCHVWGAPSIAFYITGTHTINNTYGDWALCSFYLKNTSFINVTNHFVIGSSDPSQTNWYQGNNMCMIKHKTPKNVHGIFSYFQTDASNIKILTDDTNNEDFLKKSKLRCSYIEDENSNPLFKRIYNFVVTGSNEDYHYFKIPIIFYRHITRIICYKDDGNTEIFYLLRENSTDKYYLYADLVNNPYVREFYRDTTSSTIYTKTKGIYTSIIVETYFNGIDIPTIEEISEDEYENTIVNSIKIPIICNNMNFSDYTLESNINKILYFNDVKSFGIVNNKKLSVISIPEYTNVSSYNLNAESLCYSKKNNRIARFDGTNWMCDDFATIDVSRIGSSSKRPTLTSINAGFVYYDTTLKKKILWNGTSWVNLDGSSLDTKKTGTTGERPVNVDIGFIYKDSTLNKLILWEGTKWVNLDGTQLS